MDEQVRKLLSLYAGTPSEYEINEITKYLLLFQEKATEIIEHIKYNRTISYYPRLSDFIAVNKKLSKFCEDLDTVWNKIVKKVSERKTNELDPILFQLVNNTITFERIANADNDQLRYIKRDFEVVYQSYETEIYQQELQERIRKIRNRNGTE